MKRSTAFGISASIAGLSFALAVLLVSIFAARYSRDQNYEVADQIHWSIWQNQTQTIPCSNTNYACFYYVMNRTACLDDLRCCTAFTNIEKDIYENLESNLGALMSYPSYLTLEGDCDIRSKVNKDPYIMLYLTAGAGGVFLLSLLMTIIIACWPQ